MVKHTQTIRLFDYFVGLTLKGLSYYTNAFQLHRLLKKIKPSVVFHTETSHLTCYAKQITGFYIKLTSSCWSVVKTHFPQPSLHWRKLLKIMDDTSDKNGGKNFETLKKENQD